MKKVKIYILAICSVALLTSIATTKNLETAAPSEEIIYNGGDLEEIVVVAKSITPETTKP